MAVITQFVVVREGVEKMTFTSKKEADAYDKMLDIADNLIPFIQKADLGIDESVGEKLAFYFANNKDELTYHSQSSMACHKVQCCNEDRLL